MRRKSDRNDSTNTVGGISVDTERLWRSDNISRLMLHGFQVFEQRLLEDARARGFENLRLVHFNVLRHVDFDGTRMTQLAERAGITNGAMTQAVQMVVRDGFLAVEADPADRRARIVRFTPEGWQLVETLHGLFRNVEEEMKAILGQNGFDQLLTQLRKLRAEFHASHEADGRGADDPGVRENE